MQYKSLYLKQEKLEELLKAVGIQICTETATDLICYCPFHKNIDSPAFNISKSGPYYLWKCWNGSCNSAGNIYTLLTRKGYSLREAERMLIDGIIMENEDDFLVMIDKILKQDEEEENQWTDIDWTKFISSDVDNDYPARTYVLNRGITLEAYTYFGIGYSRLKHRLIIPVYDYKNLLIGLIGRSIDHKDYQYSKSLKRHTNIWNFNNYLNSNSRTIILTEGAFDSISIWDAGLKNVGAIFGSHLSVEQAQLVREHCDEVICFFDNDAAGYAATDQVIDILPDLDVSYVEYPDRLIELPDGSTRSPKDPGCLSQGEILNMYNNRKSSLDKFFN